MLLLYHLCILNNTNYSPNGLQFIEHVINKIHLYSTIHVLGTKRVQLYDVIVYTAQVLFDLIPLMFEKGHFGLVFRTIVALADVVINSMEMFCLWVFI